MLELQSKQLRFAWMRSRQTLLLAVCCAAAAVLLLPQTASAGSTPRCASAALWLAYFRPPPADGLFSPAPSHTPPPTPRRGHLGTGYRGTPPTNFATVARPSFSATAVSNSNLGVPSHRSPSSEVGSRLPLDSLTTWQCSPQDGLVSRGGVTVDASIPCNWDITLPNRQAEATGSTTCAAAEMLAAIERKELDRRDLQVVVVRHAEDISWSDAFAAVRTVYEKPGTELPALPLTSTSAGAGPAAPEAASVVLPNVGKEQHAYLTHIVRNYDSLANRTVFLHGKKPTCGFFLVDRSTLGNHLLTNVSVLDYFAEAFGVKSERIAPSVRPLAAKPQP